MTHPGGSKVSTSACDILLVDDNENMRRALYDILSIMGYIVLLAASAEEGWLLFQQHGARLIITDNAMPSDTKDVLSDESGFQLALRVKNAFPQTPIVMLSALPPREAYDVCDIVLAKPVPMRVLKDALKQLNIYPNESCG